MSKVSCFFLGAIVALVLGIPLATLNQTRAIEQCERENALKKNQRCIVSATIATRISVP